MAYKTAIIEVKIEAKVYMSSDGEILGWEPMMSDEQLDEYVIEMADGADFEEDGVQ